MGNELLGTPEVTKKCPICGPGDGRCRQRGNLILCMTYVDAEIGDRRKDQTDSNKEYVYSGKATGAGTWGEWVLPRDREKEEQIINLRMAEEASCDRYEMSAQERHENYSKLLQQLTLEEYDRADLLRRGFTGQQIEEVGFKTVHKFARIVQEIDWRTPGLRPDGLTLYIKDSGYLCPMRDVDGRIVSFQQRLRQPKDSNKYVWLSSNVKKRPNAPSYRVDSEPPLSVFGSGLKHQPLWLTEGTGPKPAWVHFHYNAPVVGASGGMWASSPNTLMGVVNKVQPEKVILAADKGCLEPDKAGNQHVFYRYEATAELLSLHGYELKVAWWGQSKKSGQDIDELDDLSVVRLVPFSRFAKAAQDYKDKWIKEKYSEPEQVLQSIADVPAKEQAEPDEDAPWEDRLEAAVRKYVLEQRKSAKIKIKQAIRQSFGIQDKDINEVAADINRIKGGGLSGADEVLLQTYDEIEARSRGENSLGFFCGLRDLDDITQGFQRSDLIIPAGRASMGKSSLVLNIATGIANNNNLPVLFFSCEMSKKQLIYRALATEAEIDLSRLRSGRIRENEWDEIGNAIAAIAALPIYIDDTPNIYFQVMRDRVLRFYESQGKVGGIVIDYLQLMEGGEGDNRAQELSNLTRNLKGLARELNAPVFALSQINRGVESRTNKRPMMSDLKESGAIEENADLVMMLYRDSYYHPDSPDRGIAEVIITKHRNGPTGTIKLAFDERFTKFKSLSHA